MIKTKANMVRNFITLCYEQKFTVTMFNIHVQTSLSGLGFLDDFKEDKVNPFLPDPAQREKN